jgi:hypothetical protein
MGSSPVSATRKPHRGFLVGGMGVPRRGLDVVGQHFTGLVNPGAHQGTVGEEEFLRVVIGIAESELAAFCAQFG